MRLLVALFLPFLTAKAATVACDPNTPVNWSVVQPGDTIQLAAGNYSGGFKVQKSGTADKPIVIKGPASGTATSLSTAIMPMGSRWTSRAAQVAPG
jgi:hypothetical protein